MRLRVLLSIDFGSLSTDEFVADFTCADQSVIRALPLDVTFGVAKIYADEIKKIDYTENETFRIRAHIRAAHRTPRARRKIRAKLQQSGYTRSNHFVTNPISV